MSNLDFSLAETSTDSASGVLLDYRTWRRTFPDLCFARYVSENPGIEKSILIELASSDLIHQISHGRPQRAEDYLAVIPTIANNEELVLDLIDAEICALADMGNAVDRKLLESRFPKLKEKLVKLFDVHEIDLEASRDSSFLQTSISIPGYQLNRLLLENPVDQNSPGFDLWEATDNESGLPYQVILWPTERCRSQQTSPNVSRVEQILSQRIQIQDGGLAEMAEFGFANLDSNHYTYVVVRPLHAKSLIEIYNQPTGDPIIDQTVVNWMLKIFSSHSILEKAFGRSASFSPNEIFIDQNNSPVMIDFAVLASESEMDPLQMLGLLIFSICLREDDLGELKQHIEAGYEPIQLSQANEAVSEKMNAIYLSCVHPNPKRRYASLSEAIVDLQKFESGQTLHANKLQRKRFWFQR